MKADSFPMIRDVPYMGVIWVVYEASKRGFYNGHPDWCNLGQGQPEVGDMEGAPARISHLDILPGDQAYGPVGGTLEAREAVAELYNSMFRRGMKSQYKAENVSIASGGRLALMRFICTLEADSRVLYQSPDYTAYEDYFFYVRNHCTFVPMYTSPAEHFKVSSARLQSVVSKEHPSVFIFSNPCNPTGEVIQGDELAHYVRISREHNMLLAADEFYSHFIYTPDGRPGQGPVSSSAYIEDVNKDPVLIFDGLTKNHRYPGWRAGWTLGPAHCIEMINRAASAIDGGPSMLMQRVLLEAIEPARFAAETSALREGFAKKRALMLERLAQLQVLPAHAPEGTFYVWADISKLPAPLDDADALFFAGLERKVMTVPGRFFDIRPSRIHPVPEPLAHWVRFSFGPPYAVVEKGLTRLAEVVRGVKG